MQKELSPWEAVRSLLLEASSSHPSLDPRLQQKHPFSPFPPPAYVLMSVMQVWWVWSCGGGVKGQFGGGWVW